MAFTTVWSVDLGKSALKAVKLRRDKNNVEILAIDKIDYSGSQNGADDSAREALSVFKTRNEVKEPVVVAHPGQGTFSRFIKVPAFDSKKVQDMVQYEASQQIPFPLDEVIWDFHVVDREYLSGEEREVGLFAVRREAIDDFLLDFNDEGLSVEMLPIGYLSLFNYIKYDIDPQEPAVVLDIGATHTDLILIDGDRFWVRPLPHSGQDVTKAIQERFKLKFAEAEKLKTEAARAPKQAAKIFQAVIQPKLKELVQEVHRSIGYYRSQHGEVKFQRLYLLGNGSRIIGIKKFLEDQLSMMVQRVQSIQHLRINRGVNVKLLQSQLPAFGTALGAGIQALGMGACDVDLVPREEKIKKEVERKKKHVFIAAAIVFVAILISYFMIQGKLQETEGVVSRLKSSRTDNVSRYRSDVRKLKEESQTELEARRKSLLRIAEARRGPLVALRQLEAVLGQIPNGVVVDQAVPLGDDQAKQETTDAAIERLHEKVWVPWMHVSRIIYPEDKKSSARSRRSKKAAKDDPTKVPAYKFEIYAMVKMPANESEAVARIKEKLQEPLARALASAKISVVNEVSQGQGNSDHESIYVETSGSSEERRTRGGVSQEGRPFFGAPLEWRVVPRAPEKPAEDQNAKKD